MEDRGIFDASTSRNERIGLEGGNTSVIISVVENRAREICICKIDTTNPASLEIMLLTDSHSYNETIDTIQGIGPNEILLHDGSRSKVLSKKIEQECSDDSRILYISRQYFDQDNGADMLKKVLAGDVDADLVAKYTVLSGAYCILRYIENCTGSTIANHSMRVEYSGTSSARMSIDRRTAVNLELISNAKNGDQKNSLFGAINHTKTVVGARLLKSTILRPNTDVATINARLDLVEVFLKNNRVLSEVVEQLRRFPDLDKMLSGLTTVPKNITPKTAKVGIDTLIFLKQTLQIAPSLAAALEGLKQRPAGGVGGIPAMYGTTLFNNASTASEPAVSSQHALLDAILSNLREPQLGALLDSILDVITESTEFSRSAHEMRHQECFALKNGIHGLLDVARVTFLQTVEDIYRLGEQYSAQCGVTIRVTHNAARGYYLLVPASLSPLPPQFTQTVANKRTISCSTEELNSLSDRATEAITQALALTHELTQELLTTVRNNINCLFGVTDCVALMDMLTSFADLAALSPHPFARPLLRSDSGPIFIRGGRHPVVSCQAVQQLSSSFVANDLFMGPMDSMHIITGPNGAGKTVYIKQVALIVVMAQIGCLVPAKQATVSVCDRILSRIGTSDDIEHNMSTFATEMKEVAYVLNNVTDRSLVIIDELGRGTSNIDGVSIAFAIAEELLSTKALTLFVTHYPQITTLPDMYPNAKNVHLKTSIDMRNTSTGQRQGQGVDGGIVYLHEVGSGACDMRSGYGIIMAEQCGYPPDIIEDAREVRRAVRDAYPILSAHLEPAQEQDAQNLVAISGLLKQLLLVRDPSLSDEAVRRHLHSLRSQIPDDCAQQMLVYLNSLDCPCPPVSAAASELAPALAPTPSEPTTASRAPPPLPVGERVAIGSNGTSVTVEAVAVEVSSVVSTISRSADNADNALHIPSYTVPVTTAAAVVTATTTATVAKPATELSLDPKRRGSGFALPKPKRRSNWNPTASACSSGKENSAKTGSSASSTSVAGTEHAVDAEEWRHFMDEI